MTAGGTPLVGHYVVFLVVISVWIAMLSAYAALDLAERVTHSQGSARAVWLSCGAIAMGTGIWSMHYIGMLAFRLPVKIMYDWPMVLLSLLAAILSSGGGLLAVSRKTMGPAVTIMGGVFMGSGIAAMHYMGMEAMRLPAVCVYSPRLVIVSVVLAIGIALIAVWRAFALRGVGRWNHGKVANAVILGAAIPVMHYVGMAAVSFVPAPLPLAAFHHAIGISDLGLASVALVSVLMLGLVFVTSTVDRSFNRQALALEGSEQRYRRIVESTLDAFLAIDHTGVITDWSDHAESLFGWSRREALGKSVKEIIVWDEPGADQQRSLRELLSEEAAPLQVRVELTARHRDGHEFPAEAAISSLQMGPSSLFTAFVHDVTSRKREAREKEEAMAAAEEGSRVKSEFLANMSHEIRTPLNGVIGMTELALETELTVEQREYLQTVKLSADALLGVINGILDFSKIEAGKVDMEEVDFDLCECMEAALKTLALQADEKALELTCEVSPGVPDAVLGDPGKLRQILINLVSNAIKFTDAGEVALTVRLAHMIGTRILLHFVVSDTGIGIAQEKLLTVFDSFAQADTSTTREYGGTGLGLTISKHLIELMGGRIWVESELGRGSKFHFTLQFQRAETKPNKAASIDSTEIPAGVRVLVIDDNETNRRILQGLLKSWGMMPTLVCSAQEGLCALQDLDSPFELIITDMHMPKMDGFELVERIHESGGCSAATIMMLTSARHRGDLARCQQLGIAAHLTKPVRKAELREAIARVLGANQQRPIIMATQDSAQRGDVSQRCLDILLAEDNTVNQKLATRLLEKRGHKVQVVSNGLEALAALRRRSYDLALMDVQMPGLDGIQVTVALRQEERITQSYQRIVAMTALAISHERDRCLAAGMDGFIAKPIQAAELTKILEEAVAKDGSAQTMATQTPDAGLAPVDADELWDRLGGDRQFLVELIELFRVDYPRQVQLIHQAIDQNNASGLKQASHALKGALSNLSAPGAREIAANLERLGASGDLQAARSALSALEKELAKTMESLETLCQEPTL